MPDSEVHGEPNEQDNGKLLSDLALTRRQSRSLYRNWVLLSKKSVGNPFQSQANVFSNISTCSISNEVDGKRESSSTLIEDRADEIVRHIEQSQTLMDDNPKSNNDRIETLRELTEYLTLKRSVKKKLIKSIGSSSKTISFSKRIKYRISILFFKISVGVNQFLNNFELWYSSLKVIEGHFGSSVASYFKFLRKLFLLNLSIFILMFFFVMIPQLLFRFMQFMDDEVGNNSTTIESEVTNTKSLKFNFLNDETNASPLVVLKSNPYKENSEFRVGNIFTGEGFLTNTILFYGYYTNTSLKLINGYSYSIPASYFFTCGVCYVLIFIFLFVSVAVSYRKCYIEASGGMNNTFSSKIFCGWDFSIATKQAAEQKSKSIYTEIKEILDDLSKPTKRKTCLSTFYTTAISFSLNGILLFLLGVGGMYSWKYLDQQMAKADTATTMMMWLILTLVTALAPVLFSLITHIEGFESPSSALYMTLIRTFSLYAIVIAVVVAYRINRSAESECWETILGQDMYRLVLLDFIFGLIGTAASEFIRYKIYVKMWQGIGCPEFDIARSTMNLIYNQTLFYIGLYFSPVLSLIITIKMFLTFYIKKWGAVSNCRPFAKPWKASQAHTVYLSIAFFAFFSVVVAYGYIITSVKTSNCGPFRGEKFMYESLLEEIMTNKDSIILLAFYYITRPGVVGIVLMAMLLGVYYMRAVALARIHVVNHLRHLLWLKAEDRKLLLNEISKYTKNQEFHKDEEVFLPTSEDLSSKLICHNFSTPTQTSPKTEERRDKLSGAECLKKTKLSFSSLTNLLNELEKTPKSHTSKSVLFHSVQNMVDGECFQLKEMPKFTTQGTTNGCNDNTSFVTNQLFDFEKSECVVNDSSFKNQQGFSKVDSKSGCQSNNLNEELHDQNVTHLNFNPIFTESAPPESGDEDIPDNPKHRLSVDADQEGNMEEHNFSSKPTDHLKNYSRFEERVPSRISFDSDADSKILRKSIVNKIQKKS